MGINNQVTDLLSVYVYQIETFDGARIFIKDNEEILLSDEAQECCIAFGNVVREKKDFHLFPLINERRWLLIEARAFSVEHTFNNIKHPSFGTYLKLFLSFFDSLRGEKDLHEALLKEKTLELIENNHNLFKFETALDQLSGFYGLAYANNDETLLSYLQVVWATILESIIFSENGNLVTFNNDQTKINDKIDIAGLLQDKAHAEVKREKLKSALENYLKAAAIYSEIHHNTGLYVCYFQLGYIYRDLNNHEQSAKYFELSANVAKSRYRFDEWISATRQLSRSLRECGRLESSQEAIECAYQYAKFCGDKEDLKKIELKRLAVELERLNINDDTDSSNIKSSLSSKLWSVLGFKNDNK